MTRYLQEIFATIMREKAKNVTKATVETGVSLTVNAIVTAGLTCLMGVLGGATTSLAVGAVLRRPLYKMADRIVEWVIDNERCPKNNTYQRWSNTIHTSSPMRRFWKQTAMAGTWAFYLPYMVKKMPDMITEGLFRLLNRVGASATATSLKRHLTLTSDLSASCVRHRLLVGKFLAGYNVDIKPFVLDIVSTIDHRIVQLFVDTLILIAIGVVTEKLHGSQNKDGGSNRARNAARRNP